MHFYIMSLVRLSRHLEHEKSFKDMTSHDIIDRQMYTFQCRDCGQELYLDYESQVQVVREFYSRQKTTKLA